MNIGNFGRAFAAAILIPAISSCTYTNRQDIPAQENTTLSNGFVIDADQLLNRIRLRNGTTLYEVSTGYDKRDWCDGDMLYDENRRPYPKTILIFDEGDGMPYTYQESYGSSKSAAGECKRELTSVEKRFNLTYEYSDDCIYPIWQPEVFRSCPEYRAFGRKLKERQEFEQRGRELKEQLGLR